MTDLQVAHQGVKVAVADLDALASSLRRCDTFVQTYFSVQPGGRFVTDVSGLVSSLREQLGHQYLSLAGTVETAGDTVLGIWNDFERVDAQARIEFERNQQRGGMPPLTKPPPPIAPHPTPAPAAPVVDSALLEAPLVDPHAYVHAFEVLKKWGEIKDCIDKVFAYGWLTERFKEVGLHVPIEQFRKQMEGRYVDMAEATAGLLALGETFAAAGSQLDAEAAQLGGHWLGESSTAVQQWLTQLAGLSLQHSRHLDALGWSIHDQAVTMKVLLDQLLDLLDDLADMLPLLDAAVEGLAQHALNALERLAGVAGASVRIGVKVAARVELIFDITIVIITLLGRGPTDVTFPPVTTPTARPR